MQRTVRSGRPMLFSAPTQAYIAKAAQKLGHQLSTFKQRLRDMSQGGYFTGSECPMLRFRYLSSVSNEALEKSAPSLLLFCERYLSHRFNLLGSGWVRVKHGMKCAGLEGNHYQATPEISRDHAGTWLEKQLSEANLCVARDIWSLVDEAYTPIDWQLDFKSGYRWSERTWYLDVRYGHLRGVDVKVPWELARMQHLVQLALGYQASHSLNREEFAGEFRNQILDFVATNPPRFGVNWRCTMEVAIRVANWLLAWDLFVANGARFDDAFKECLSKSVYEHGLHIINNLEWVPKFAGNHYLANITGLLFVAAYLQSTRETDSWLCFAIHQLLAEVENQFTADGGNFEASTSYHRLAAEMVVYSTALAARLLSEHSDRFRGSAGATAAIGLGRLRIDGQFGESVSGRPQFSAAYLARLEKMAEFSLHSTKPSGRVVQTGDNDNGRFVKLEPIAPSISEERTETLATSLDESYLDHRHLVSAVNGLFNRQDFSEFAGLFQLDGEMVRALSAGTIYESYLRPGERMSAERVRTGSARTLCDVTRDIESLSLSLGSRHSQEFAIPSGAMDGLTLAGYPDFGLYIFRARGVFLAVRCGPVGQNGIGGHAHHDQLSIELWIDGHDVVVDPGTYLYTALPERRNQYRSVFMHSGPRPVGCADQGFGMGLFTMLRPPTARCTCFCEEGFAGEMQWNRNDIMRVILLSSDHITVIDGSRTTYLEKIDFSRGASRFSPGYGILEPLS